MKYASRHQLIYTKVILILQAQSVCAMGKEAFHFETRALTCMLTMKLSKICGTSDTLIDKMMFANSLHNKKNWIIKIDLEISSRLLSATELK